MERFYLVAVNTPFNNSLLTYKSSGPWRDGQFVKVPLGKRQVMGCILEELNQAKLKSENIDYDKLKSFDELWTDAFTLSSDELKLYRWCAEYYHYPLGQLLSDSLPKVLKRPRPMKHDRGEGRPLEFSPTLLQQSVIDSIEEKLGLGHSRHLIHGITGSGKTVIYFHIMKKVLEAGKSVIFLLPEINLTPQFLDFFYRYLDVPIYSYSSAVTASAKYNLWNHVAQDDGPKVLVGVRSAIFLPVKNPGLIIVDEEHDSSFKQEDRCPYNARDLALFKGRHYQIPVLLGSATPSMESYELFKKRKTPNSFLHELTERPKTATLPEVVMVDSRNETNPNYDVWPFNQTSLNAIQEAIEKKEQVLVFVNRLGYANYLQCRACGHQFICPNCSVSLRYFQKKHELSCYLCDYRAPKPEICPSCKNMNLLPKGYGTERLEAILKNEFPEVSVARFDRDEIRNFSQLKERLDDFSEGKFQILVGTQMLSKGHNFEKVNLVVVFGMDSQLNYPDYRSNERVYQLLTQISGRSGRFGNEGRVLIHTLNPEIDLFQQVQGHAFNDFYEDDLEIRRLCQTPPFQRVIMLYYSCRFLDRVKEAADQSVQILQRLQSEHFSQVMVLGPRPAVIEKRVNNYTWCIMLKSSDLNQLHNMVENLKRLEKPHSSVSIKIDVDPYTLG